MTWAYFIQIPYLIFYSTANKLTCTRRASQPVEQRSINFDALMTQDDLSTCWSSRPYFYGLPQQIDSHRVETELLIICTSTFMHIITNSPLHQTDEYFVFCNFYPTANKLNWTRRSAEPVLLNNEALTSNHWHRRWSSAYEKTPTNSIIRVRILDSRGLRCGPNRVGRRPAFSAFCL